MVSHLIEHSWITAVGYLWPVLGWAHYFSPFVFSSVFQKKRSPREMCVFLFVTFCNKHKMTDGLSTKILPLFTSALKKTTLLAFKVRTFIEMYAKSTFQNPQKGETGKRKENRHGFYLPEWLSSCHCSHQSPEGDLHYPFLHQPNFISQGDSTFTHLSTCV